MATVSHMARVSPEDPKDSPLARLVAERGATMPAENLLELEWSDGVAPDAPPSIGIFDELREDRL